MDREVKLRIVMERPPAGIDFGPQKGHGNEYETVCIQRSGSKDMTFEFAVGVKGEGKHAAVAGPFIQGPPTGRFLYIDIGKYAGQKNTAIARRLKIPLTITSEMIAKAVDDPRSVLETRVPGTGRDGGPNCATVKPFSGWRVKR